MGYCELVDLGVGVLGCFDGGIGGYVNLYIFIIVRTITLNFVLFWNWPIHSPSSLYIRGVCHFTAYPAKASKVPRDFIRMILIININNIRHENIRQAPLPQDNVPASKLIYINNCDCVSPVALVRRDKIYLIHAAAIAMH